jgi:hypothetical protein
MPRSSTARSSATRSSARRSASARVLTDYDEIRRWAEERNARPARVKGTGGNGDIGIIRLDFPGYTGRRLLRRLAGTTGSANLIRRILLCWCRTRRPAKGKVISIN